MMRRLGTAALAATLLTGCVYYNGMYNARRLSEAAEKAKREGRTLDASTYWGQVTVKAETLLSRHPDSKFAPEAEYLLGRARAELGSCDRARPMLLKSLPRLADTTLAQEGNLVLARCQAALGDHAAAIALLTGLVDRVPLARRQDVRIALAHSQRLAGRPVDAISSLQGIGERAVLSERMLALAEAGQTGASIAVADSLIAARDSTAPWDSAIAVIARHDPTAASSLVDRLLPLSGTDPEQHARRLLEDGGRLTDPARREARLRQAATAGGRGSSAATARFELLRLGVQRMRSRSELDSIATAFAREGDDSPLAIQIQPIARVLERVRAADSLHAATPQGDLRLFLVAEAARDVLHAPQFAAMLFRRIPEIWPGSLYAPKALLAAERLDPQSADLVTLLEERYAGNPYVEAVKGADPIALRILEDSLGAFAARMEPRPVPPGRTSRDSTNVRRPVPGQPRPSRTTVEQ